MEIRTVEKYSANKDGIFEVANINLHWKSGGYI